MSTTRNANKLKYPRQGLGAHLKVARIERGLTQARLAKMFSVHSQTVSDWERNRLRLSEDQLAEMMRKLESLPPRPKPPTRAQSAKAERGRRQVARDFAYMRARWPEVRAFWRERGEEMELRGLSVDQEHELEKLLVTFAENIAKTRRIDFESLSGQEICARWSTAWSAYLDLAASAFSDVEMGTTADV
jgi:transcriptional regulator with XRE-family HTH domain